MPDQDAAWLDAQYNNRARIPEHPAIFARWRADSAAARAALPSRRDQAYGPGANDRLDLFLPRRPSSPVLVFIHGGYWRSLSKDDHAFVAPAFVDAGAMVVIPEYDLCPAVRIEHIALQMAHALAWVWRHAARHGGDPQRIVVAGHSAGAHLAAMLLCCEWKRVAPDLPADLLHHAVGISGLYDMAPIGRTPFLQADLRLDEASVQRLSPCDFAPPRGRLLALAGARESEEFLRQNRLIRDCWGDAAVPVCDVVPGRHHLDVLDDLVDPGGKLHRHALGLLGLAPLVRS